MIPHNRYNHPVAPLNGEYHLPAPPRHSLPGTKTAKEKAGHVVLSLLCSAGLVVVWRLVADLTIHGCFGVVLAPLAIGVLWGFVPLIQDSLITVNLARHSYTYNYVHQANAEELRAVSAEWSAKHNAPHMNKQIFEVQHRSREEKLEAENRRLLQALTKARGGVWDLDTEALNDLE